MNDTAAQRQPQQPPMPEFDFGDYITSSAPTDTQAHANLELYPEFSHQPRNNAQISLDANMTTQDLLGAQTRMDHDPSRYMSAEMLTLKGRLEEQMKLQQLQQFILQQQIALISGQPAINHEQKEALFHGLLTPGPSTELAAIVPKDLVPPMMLQSEMFINNNSSPTSLVNPLSPHAHAINPSFSAPAALAFPTSPPFPLPSPAQPGYDLSPLTSPWILPGPTSHHHHHQQQHTLPHVQQQQQQQQQQRPHLKRTISFSDHDQDGTRKRTSPNADSAAIAQARSDRSTPPSAGSTPMLGLGSGHTQLFTPSKDTPSPVDLSMPPPAPPAANSEHNVFSSTSVASPAATLSRSASESVSPDIAPMTPASILNLRKLSTGLMPAALSLGNPEKKDATSGAAAAAAVQKTNKSKSVPKPSPHVVTRGRRGSLVKPGFSPNLKPLLPGVPPTPTSPLAHPTSSSSHAPPSSFTLPTSSSSSSSGIQGPRKTSHKAAEQKRRDSLKTSFDELRLLLPPVPLLPEDAGDEPPLPGSMPPRGPPKGDADGPNRGVSKLALLRCGNGYIRDLKEMVRRRDGEIELLRAEVRRLRAVLGKTGGEAEAGALDLDRDLDCDVLPCPSQNSVGMDEHGGEGDEDGAT